MWLLPDGNSPGEDIQALVNGRTDARPYQSPGISCIWSIGRGVRQCALKMPGNLSVTVNINLWV
jgi:hypothetical protein